jgi:transposase
MDRLTLGQRCPGKGVFVTRGGRPYPAEFKARAVQLYRESGRSLREVSEELGVSLEALRQWIKQSAVDAGEAQGLTSSEREELRQLRREVKTLRMEKEILKKAAAFFATEEANRIR